MRAHLDVAYEALARANIGSAKRGLTFALGDSRGVGDGSPSCHACQGIGVQLFANYDTGMVAWSGQQKGWASLYDSGMGSKQAQALAEKQIPNAPDFDAATMNRQQALANAISSKYSPTITDTLKLTVTGISTLGKAPIKLAESCRRRAPQLEAALDFAREGGVLVITKIDRIASSVANLCEIEAKLHAKGASLKLLMPQLRHVNSIGRLVFNMVGGIAQFEREIMRERQREGIAKAKSEGKYNALALRLTTAPGNFIPNAKDQ